MTPPQTPGQRLTATDGAIRVRRALISVSDKTGVADFAKGLAALGVEILSTGGTAQRPARGRARGHRRLRVHRPGGDPRRPGEDAAPAAARGAAGAPRRPRATWRRWSARGSSRSTWSASTSTPSSRPIAERRRRRREDAIENIDIGGPTMIRAAAKNHEGVAVVVKPESYDAVLRRAGGDRRRGLRLDPALARQRGLRPDRPLRRRDQPLVLDLLRGLPRAPGRSPTRRCSTSPTARTRTSGRRSTPRSALAATSSRGSRSCTARRSPSTTCSTSTRPARLLDDFERPGLRDRQAQQPLRGRDRRRRARGLREGAAPATRCPPTAA